MNTIYYYKCHQCGSTWQSDRFTIVECPNKCLYVSPYLTSSLTDTKEISKFWWVLAALFGMSCGVAVAIIAAFVWYPDLFISLW